MENQRKYVVLSYLCVAAVAAYVLFNLMFKIVATYDLEAKVRHADLIAQGVAVGVGVILFLGLVRHQKANEFMDEVMNELSRVSWPTGAETYKGTIVVLIMVIISGLFLGGLDSLWTWLMKFIL